MIVYLTVKNLEGLIDEAIIPLINVRGNCGKVIEIGDKWQDLKDGFAMRVGELGRADLIIKHKGSVQNWKRGELITKKKEGQEYWILPFENSPHMTQPQHPDEAFVLSSDELKNFGWDIEVEPI